MAGEGSILGMIISLRNNKNLLPGRVKGFFRRELNYHQLRQYYRDSTVPIEGGKISEEYLKKVRAKIFADQRKQSRRLIFISLLVSAITITGIIFILSSTIYSAKHRSSKGKHPDFRMKEDNYVEMVKRGDFQLAEKDYFMAVGNYEKALVKKPNEFHIEMKLAKAICLLCYRKKLECEKAQRIIRDYQSKYPELAYLDRLESRYLKKRKKHSNTP